MSERSLGPIVDAAAALLESTAGLLESIDDAAYARPSPACQDASIGQHVRHLTDHFASLVDGYEADAPVCYDQRKRGTDIESDRAAAAAMLRGLRSRIADLDDTQLNFSVRIRVLPAPGAAEVDLETSLGRELAFVTHHAVHHHAIIRVIAAEQGVDLGDAFGRAPATVQAENG